MSKLDRKNGEKPTESPKVDNLREARRDFRFKLYVDLKIRSFSMGSISGRTLEISERGFSATLPVELPIGEVVDLNIRLRIGNINIHATVSNRSAFRHGFQFFQPNPALHMIRENCCLLERIPNPSVRNRFRTLGRRQ
jgi:PilZ domain-containing protein